MHILVTNDDGVTAPGLLALAQAMRSLPDVKVSILAPDRNWSGSGHVKTLERPLRVRDLTLADGSPAFTSDGAPSDCVALALLGFFEEKIDLVVSGINPMHNLGHDVTYSGTVTAAMEAVIWDTPGIAFSLGSLDNHLGALDYTAAAEIARRVVSTTREHRFPPGMLLNVNIPYLPLDQIKGVRITRQGLRVYRDRLDRRIDPRGKPYYWIGGDSPTGTPEEGTDVGAVAAGYVSITPIQLDLTMYSAIPTLGDWDWKQA
ncbi:MAG: 5'/3'-nucleotidase SurE [Anaerolineales bacterium]|nr:5'/3'-nucleotidase SurE [Anaerolineales bacterium]MDW8277851.1 5'/3'-nucleotidase SurE [Anaerolineales bacterium]